MPEAVLDIIPEMELFIGISEITGISQMLIVTFIMWQNHFKEAPKLLALLAIMYMLRGFAIVLTPLAQIQPPAENFSEAHFIAQTFYHGMFFSGHAAAAFVQMFFTKTHRLLPIVALLAFIQAFSLLASHSHYSIDIFGAFFVAYFITHFDFFCLIPKSWHNAKWAPWCPDETRPSATT